MREDFVLYGEIKQMFQSAINRDNYEQILLRLTNQLIQKRNISDIPEIEEYKMRICIDCLRECKAEKEQLPILNLMVGKLETAIGA